MEKHTRTYDLSSIKEVFSSVEALGTRTTASAFRSSQQLGFSREDMVSAIQCLQSSDFYKSMTTYADHKIWQDVYHAKFGDLVIYVKFCINKDGDYMLISFKEK